MRPSPLSSFAVGLCFAIVLAVSSSSDAQGPPRQSLLLQESVQADLGLSDKQKSQLNGIQASFGPKSRDTFLELQANGASPDEMQEAMISLGREHQASLSRVLEKPQKTRLAQIELQREGFLAASRSEIASKLKLNPTQTKKIKTILDEMRQANARAMPAMLGGLQPGAEPAAPPKASAKTKKGSTKRARPGNGNAGAGNEEMAGEGDFGGGEFNGGPFPTGGFPGGFAFGTGGPPGGLPDFLKPENQPDFAKMMEAQKKNRDEAGTKIGEVLTADQKTAFEKLTGKPFDFTKIQAASTDPKTAEEGQPKVDEAEKKEMAPPAKEQSKSKAKKSGGK